MSLTKSEKMEHSRQALEISIEQSVFEAAVEKAYRKNVKRITVPGFRKGKAPRHIIERLYGKGYFYDDALNDLLPDAYDNAVKEADIRPVSRPKIDVKSIDENGVVLSVEVDVYPEIEISDYFGLKAPKNEAKVTDEEIDARIEMARNRESREIEVTDRSVEKDDTVKISYVGYVDGKPFDGGSAEDYSLKIGSNSFIPGFEDQIIGKNVNDKFDVNVKFPDDYHAKDLAGKDAVFQVELKGITKIELPALDDEFAKDVSEFDTFEAYKNSIREDLLKQHEESVENEFMNKICDQLIEKMQGEIPASMFEEEIDSQLESFENNFKAQGISMDMYLKYTGSDLNKIRESIRPNAERKVKLDLIIGKIADAEKVEVTDEDVDAKIKDLAGKYNMEEEKLRENLKDSMDGLKYSIKMTKTYDLIKEKSVALPPEAEEKKDADEKAAEKPKKKTTTKKTAKKTEEQ